MVYYLSFILSLFILSISYITIKNIKRLGLHLEGKEQYREIMNFFPLLKNVLIILIVFLTILFILSSIPGMHNVAFSLLASSGICVTLLGFAAQSPATTIVTGLFLRLNRPFVIGDTIKIGDNLRGKVENITLYYTILRTPDNKKTLIPHSILDKSIIENQD